MHQAAAMAAMMYFKLDESLHGADEMQHVVLCYITGQQSHYPPGNHHASHVLKCPISRS